MQKPFLTSVAAVLLAIALSGCQGTDMVRIGADTTKGNAAFMIDVFEAHLENDATGNSKAVSTASKTPAISITFDAASTACANAGKRLCTTLEWQVACKGMTSQAFGFQDAIDAPKKVSDVCNVGKAIGATTGVQLTGKATACRSNGYNVSDMIGNVSEWTTKNDQPVASGSNGYSDVSDAANLDCSVSATGTKTDSSDSLGFRCCKSQ